jgi:tRNA dimethylallyltransferase
MLAGNCQLLPGALFFYVDALLGRIVAPAVPPNPLLRTELEKLSNEELLARLETADPARAAAIDRHNARRLVRALEIVEVRGSVPKPITDELYDAHIIGIQIDKEQLHKNIHTRLLARLDAGMVEEVRNLHHNGLSYERMEDLGLEYRYIARYLQGKLSYEEMVQTLEIKIRQFAKRQMTWLKRDTSIEWR